MVANPLGARGSSVAKAMADRHRALRLDLFPPSWNQRNVSQITKRPEAEVVVDTETVRALLRTQHPDLCDLPLAEVAVGWDNFIFRLGETMAVRLPRRAASATLLEHEQHWLPIIARHLPISVPAPLRIGTPGEQYPWQWSIVPWLSGQPADLAPLDADQAKPLAHFLRALHIAAPPDAPKNPSRGTASTESSCGRRTHSSSRPKDFIGEFNYNQGVGIGFASTTD